MRDDQSLSQVSYSWADLVVQRGWRLHCSSVGSLKSTHTQTPADYLTKLDHVCVCVCAGNRKKGGRCLVKRRIERELGEKATG